MKAVAQGMLEGDQVVVADAREGQRLYAKGHVGTPRRGGGLVLSRVEAAHAIHAGRLAMDQDWTELAHGREVAYLAYADLRDRGLVVRHDGGAFLVWRRGDGPEQEPWFRFHARSERTAVAPRQLAAVAGDILSVVDEDGGVTHYQVTPAAPEGGTPWPEGDREAHLLDDRVVVPGGMPGRHALGTQHGDDLVLSLTEAEALRRRGVLRLPDDLAAHAEARQHHFTRTLPVYEALRDAGVVAKSGFRFGTHLRGYSGHPEDGHAEWLIQCAHADDALHWSELSRAVRLAHGVRKSFLVAITDPVTFVALSWFRP